jgi:hypothetical protein
MDTMVEGGTSGNLETLTRLDLGATSLHRDLEKNDSHSPVEKSANAWSCASRRATRHQPPRHPPRTVRLDANATEK